MVFLLVFWSVCCFWLDLPVWSMMNMIALGLVVSLFARLYYSSIAAIPDRYTDSLRTVFICPRCTCLSQPAPQPISAPVIPMRKALVRPTESADAVPPTSSSPFDFQTVGNPSTKTHHPRATPPNPPYSSPLSTFCNCLQLLVSPARNGSLLRFQLPAARLRSPAAVVHLFPSRPRLLPAAAERCR